MRTFLALDIDASIREAIVTAEQAIDECGEPIRWIAKENLHVTLNFLGEVAPEEVQDVCGLACDVAAEFQPITFHVRGILAVPPAGHLRMLWAGVDDLAGPVTRLHSILSGAMASIGVKQEKRTYRPHVTLARFKNVHHATTVRSAIEPWHDEIFGQQRAQRITVYASELTPNGAVYTPLAHAPLGK